MIPITPIQILIAYSLLTVLSFLDALEWFIKENTIFGVIMVVVSFWWGMFAYKSLESCKKHGWDTEL